MASYSLTELECTPACSTPIHRPLLSPRKLHFNDDMRPLRSAIVARTLTQSPLSFMHDDQPDSHLALYSTSVVQSPSKPLNTMYSVLDMVSLSTIIATHSSDLWCTLILEILDETIRIVPRVVGPGRPTRRGSPIVIIWCGARV
jgi:hypothetical protein